MLLVVVAVVMALVMHALSLQEAMLLYNTQAPQTVKAFL